MRLELIESDRESVDFVIARRRAFLLQTCRRAFSARPDLLWIEIGNDYYDAHDVETFCEEQEAKEGVSA